MFLNSYSYLKVVDCRVCGDPHSVLRFAFVEFADERKLIAFPYKSLWDFAQQGVNDCLNISCHVESMSTDGARQALNLGGTVLGYYPVRVLPSKTAILPVNPTFLPRVWMSNSLDFSWFEHNACIFLLVLPVRMHMVEFLLSGSFNVYYKMQSDDEREMCSRTVYCTNIDKKVYKYFLV